MIRKLMASTAIAALLTTGAIAQTTQPASENQAQAQGGVDVKTQQASDEALASNWMGKTVYSSAGPDAETVGDVDDLLVDESGNITAAILGVGGFLGLGEHQVAIPYDQFELTQDQDGEARLVLNTTEDQLKNAPRFQREEGQMTFTEMQERGDTPVEGTRMAQGSADQNAGQQDGQQMAADAPAALAGVAFIEYRQDQDRITRWLGREVYSSTARPASEAMNSSTSMATNDAMDNAQGTSGQTGMAQNEPSTGAGSGTMNSAQTLNSGQAGTQPNAGLAANEQQSIGEVGDIILSDAGQIESVVIDVGGFLGVGEKAVAIPFDEFQLTEVPNEQEPRLTLAMSREQLEQAEPFDASAYDADNLASNEPAMGTDAAGSSDMAASGQDATSSRTANSEASGTMTGSSGTMRTATAGMRGTSADNLLGSTVYGSNDESVGEIDDVIVSRRGDVEAVVIDVGGFLGIGAKPVAVEYDTLNVQKDTDGETRYSISATEDQLDSAPAYEETR